MESISGGLPDIAPISWAVRAQSILYTVAVPIRRDGSFELGDIEAQADLAFENLRRVVTSAGGSLQDVVQVVIYLTNVADSAIVSKKWEKHFSPPWPNRAIIGVNALTILGMKIEMIATAVLQS